MRTRTMKSVRVCAQKQELREVSVYDGLVLRAGEEERGDGGGAWDGGALGGPVVRCMSLVGGEQAGDSALQKRKWSMWYHARPVDGSGEGYDHDACACTGRVGLATSEDGVHWTRGDASVADAPADAPAGIVLEPNTGDWWSFDTLHVGVGDVTLLGGGGDGGGGVFWMFYYGGNVDAAPRVAEPAVKGVATRIGVALSQDGVHWSRIEGPHHTGALLDVGDAGGWDALCMMRPSIIAGVGDTNGLRMYYHGVDAETGMMRIGMARSSDGFTWEKAGMVFGAGPTGSFDECGVSSCQVVRNEVDDGFTMFYQGEDSAGRTCIGAATSTDGIQWQRGARPVLEPADTDGAWDAGGVGAPFAVPMAHGKWRLYYEGRATARESGASSSMTSESRRATGIGLALSGEDGIRGQYRRRAYKPANV